MVIALGARFLTAAIRPIADAQVLPFDVPPHGFLGGVLGVGVGAFLVTGALAGREGVVDLAGRNVRWRVPVRWYLVALFTVPVGATLISLGYLWPTNADITSGWLAASAGGGGRRLSAAAGAFQLAEEIGFTGFLHHNWQDRYRPMKLTLYVVLLWAVWHKPVPRRVQDHDDLLNMMMLEMSQRVTTGGAVLDRFSST